MCPKLVACCRFPKPCHCCGGNLFARVQPKALHRFMHPTSLTWHMTSVSWLSLPVLPCLIVFKIQSCHHLFITLPSTAVSGLPLFMTKVILCGRTVEKMPQKSELNVPLNHLCKPVWGGEQTIWENNVAKIKCCNFDHFSSWKTAKPKNLENCHFQCLVYVCVHICNKRTHLTLVPRSWVQKEGSINTWQQCFNPHKSITKPLLRGRYQLQGKLSQAEWVSEPEYH